MQNSVLSKIQPRTVGKEIVSRLRAAIISGRLELGSHLAESELAEQLDVSRIPIREALRELEQEGLVTRHPNRGCFVINFSEQDVKEVFSLRSMLEGMSFEWAIPNLTEKDCQALDGLIQAQSQAVGRQDFDELARLDMRFHETICLIANHSRLLKSWYEQHAQCQILLNLRFRALADYTPETVIHDHACIFEALKQRDPQRALQLTQEISERVTRECIATLQQLNERMPA